MIFDKGAKTISCRKNSLFNKCYWNNWIASTKRMKLDYHLTPHTNINSNGSINHLNIRAKTIKVLEENIVVSITFDLSVNS